MKRLILSLAVVIPFIIAHAMTVNDLFKKYRSSIPDAQYTELKGKALKNQIDSVSTDREKEILRNAKKVVMLGWAADNEQYDNLIADLNELKGYNCAMSYTENGGTEEDSNTFKSMINSLVNPAMKVSVYGKETSSGQYILQPVIVVNYMGMAVIVYVDGKIRPGDEKELIQTETDTDITIEE